MGPKVFNCSPIIILYRAVYFLTGGCRSNDKMGEIGLEGKAERSMHGLLFLWFSSLCFYKCLIQPFLARLVHCMQAERGTANLTTD